MTECLKPLWLSNITTVILPSSTSYGFCSTDFFLSQISIFAVDYVNCLFRWILSHSYLLAATELLIEIAVVNFCFSDFTCFDKYCKRLESQISFASEAVAWAKRSRFYIVETVTIPSLHNIVLISLTILCWYGYLFFHYVFFISTNYFQPFSVLKG